MQKALLYTLALMVSSLAYAADPVLSESNQLMGANNVEVNGAFYDVRFLDGTCAELFDGCDELSDFISLPNGTTAEDLLNALIDETQGIFTGTYNSNPSNTNGCGSNSQCFLHLPFEPVTGSANAATYYVDNRAAQTIDGLIVNQISVVSNLVLGISPSVDFSNFDTAALIVAGPAGFFDQSAKRGMSLLMKTILIQQSQQSQQ